MVNEHDRVVLTADVPNEGLKASDVGTVVHIYGQAEAMEVEFLALDGATFAVATLTASQVRPVSKRDITHARTLATA
jgi:urease beta subunit